MLLRWRYLTDKTGGAKDLVLQPALVILPLLPLSLPILWLGLHGLGTARLHLMVSQAEPVCIRSLAFLSGCHLIIDILAIHRM